MAVLYMRLDYEEYKALEKAMREFKETTHGKGSEWYHKSIRLPISDGLKIEFHGPDVMARQHRAVVVKEEG